MRKDEKLVKENGGWMKKMEMRRNLSRVCSVKHLNLLGLYMPLIIFIMTLLIRSTFYTAQTVILISIYAIRVHLRHLYFSFADRAPRRATNFTLSDINSFTTDSPRETFFKNASGNCLSFLS